VSWGVLPWVYPVWASLGFLHLGDYFLPILGKFSTIISISIFSWPFFLSSDSRTPMTQMLGCLTSSEVSEVSLISFHYLFFFPLCFIYLHHSIFHLTYPIFCLSYSTAVSLHCAFDLSYCTIHY